MWAWTPPSGVGLDTPLRCGAGHPLPDPVWEILHPPLHPCVWALNSVEMRGEFSCLTANIPTIDHLQKFVRFERLRKRSVRRRHFIKTVACSTQHLISIVIRRNQIHCKCHVCVSVMYMNAGGEITACLRVNASFTPSDYDCESDIANKWILRKSNVAFNTD